MHISYKMTRSLYQVPYLELTCALKHGLPFSSVKCPLSLSPQKLLLKIVLPREMRKMKLWEDHRLTFQSGQ